MVRSKVTITMEGELPCEAFFDGYKHLIEERIQGDVTEELGEYEIGGEFFGNDEGVYALFLESVELEKNTDDPDPNESKIETLEARISSLESDLKETQRELDAYKCKPEKYSLGELTVRYCELPFCEHCGEGYTGFGVELTEPDGGTSWCLDCFTFSNNVCDQDVQKIEETLARKEKIHYQEET